jgi:hypothetical protein
LTEIVTSKRNELIEDLWGIYRWHKSFFHDEGTCDRDAVALGVFLKNVCPIRDEDLPDSPEDISESAQSFLETLNRACKAASKASSYITCSERTTCGECDDNGEYLRALAEALEGFAKGGPRALGEGYSSAPERQRKRLSLSG